MRLNKPATFHTPTLWTIVKMKLIILILTLLTVYILGCEKTNNKLFWITENTGHGSDFLFLAESANVGTLKSDSLKFFLKTKELETIDSTSTTF
jgi:hypothetical protein